LSDDCFKYSHISNKVIFYIYRILSEEEIDVHLQALAEKD